MTGGLRTLRAAVIAGIAGAATAAGFLVADWIGAGITPSLDAYQARESFLEAVSFAALFFALLVVHSVVVRRLARRMESGWIVAILSWLVWAPVASYLILIVIWGDTLEYIAILMGSILIIILHPRLTAKDYDGWTKGKNRNPDAEGGTR